MSTLRHNRAFTLVEIVAALGAFSIAFLAGFAAIGALMIRQDINYRSTVAASAAMLFLREGKTKAYDPTDVNFEVKFMSVAGGYAIPDNTLFRGYPVSLPALTPGTTYPGVDSKKIYTFKNGLVDINGATDSAGKFVDLSEYRAVLWTKVASVNKLIFWYGAPEEIEAGRATTLDFLGVYEY